MSLIPGLGRSPGKGNGNLLQYSYLESPMNWRAWWATWGCKRVGQNLVTKQQTKQNNKKECEKIYIHMHICICVYVYVYIHIYMRLLREMFRISQAGEVLVKCQSLTWDIWRFTNNNNNSLNSLTLTKAEINNLNINMLYSDLHLP